ncbi:PGF-CTERM-anchored ABC transporter substrate-binding protein [Haloarcula sp. S1AR25-5A]|uniref:PGF-CTERM-anchored ABC transporter substrate-binding protein n=1 Tax=Haloarcula terrestris TaxID=2950533 RepID=A0AAE4JHZ5_9EURY|nr:PGF-CTERM-anchored ABC transporter substrate-binding protein [Haloarcula terrestris]MDS0222020.1 PGF-CTERM-anchored ABC transporter substrate-binding protein [Haloarcula terrestris]
MRRLSLACLCILLVGSLAAVTPAGATAPTQADDCSFPVTMTDATGTEVTIEERPERITTTNPSAAQTMWEIGGRSQVVGLTQYASYLDGAANRTNVSASFGVSVERVVGTEPDLVLAPNASAGDVAPLRQAGLTVYHFPAATTIDDIRAKTTTTGRLTGNCEGATEANAWMDANVDAVRQVTAAVEDRPAALYPLGGGYVAAGNTFVTSLIELVGAENVAARNHTQYPQLSDEVILQLDPDVLFVTENTATIAETEPYASTTAGETNSTVSVRVQDINQPAPRSVVWFAHNATAQLYPDRYDGDSYVPRSAVALTPTETATTQTAPSTTNATPDRTTTDASGPGFTAVTALVALLALIGTLRRRGA